VSKNKYNTEASPKYFTVQVLASSTLLFIIMIKTLTEDLFAFERNPYTPIIICIPLLHYYLRNTRAPDAPAEHM